MRTAKASPFSVPVYLNRKFWGARDLAPHVRHDAALGAALLRLLLQVVCVQDEAGRAVHVDRLRVGVHDRTRDCREGEDVRENLRMEEVGQAASRPPAILIENCRKVGNRLVLLPAFGTSVCAARAATLSPGPTPTHFSMRKMPEPQEFRDTQYLARAPPQVKLRRWQKVVRRF